MLAAMRSQSVAFSLVGAFARLGWILIGSPGIFGVPTARALCLPAKTLVTTERMTPGYQAGPDAEMNALAGPLIARWRRPVSILPNRRKTDQLVSELARAHRNLGVLYAVAILKPPLLAQDWASALGLLEEIEREATR